MCCSLAPLARPRAVVALAMQDGRARVPVRLVAPVRSQTYVNIHAGLHAACSGRSIAGAPAPLSGPFGPCVPYRSASLLRPRGRCPRFARANRGRWPRGLRSATAESITAARGGLPSLSGPAVQLPLFSDSVGSLPPRSIVIFASGLRPACLRAHSAHPLVKDI